MEIVPVIGDDKPPKTKDFRGRNLRSLKQGLERLLGRRTITITEYDPTYKVAYLGNVLTGWAKGDSCTEKPLNTIWKSYTSTTKPDVHMKLIVTQSGLKAITKEHGHTEYWSHRVTYCCAPTELPKIFCWVYRHEGRKLKQELRCHAVLCTKESIARQIANQLQARLAQALIEFKRDKISRQNARLSLANSVYENPSLPRRKILLSTGANNYRPPLERSKSAPKLMSIEESLEEEDENLSSSANNGVGGGGVLGDHYPHHRKLPRRVDLARAKFATCRNLTYSCRGGGTSRMGGLHGMRLKTVASSNCAADKIESSHDKTSSNNDDEKRQAVETVVANNNNCCNDVVEQNPFGRDCELDAVAFDRQLKLTDDDDSSRNGSVVDDDDVARRNDRLLMGCLRDSWTPLTDDEYDGDDDRYSSCPPSYVHTSTNGAAGNGDTNLTTITMAAAAETDDDSGKFDSLVRSRRRLFECGERSPNLGGRRCYEASTSPRRSLIRNRKKLFERTDRVSTSSSSSQSSNNEDADSALQFDFSEEPRDQQSQHHRGRMDSGVIADTDCGPYGLVDDESATPSLQSISSGSDTSSPSNVVTGCGGGGGGKNYDLDSLWEEEDSDESGFVESIGGGQEANDDKIRDLPHHMVMKQCGVLSSKQRCVEV